MKIVSLVIFLCSSVAGWAASGSIKGKVIDLKTKESLEFVNIVIHNYETKQYVKGSVTDQTGEFAINSLQERSYTITASYIGMDNSVVTDIFCFTVLTSKSNLSTSITLLNTFRAASYPICAI